jgi:hypothetical protein
MINRSLLAASIAVALVQHAAAAPLLPINARGLAMGNTGVASAKMVHAPQYNPALLSTANDTDDFSISFPQLGIIFSDEDKLIESFDDIANEDYADDGSGNQESIIDHFDTVLTNLDNLLSKGSNSVEQKITILETALNDSSADTDTYTTNLRAASLDLDTSVGSVQIQTGDLTQTTFDLTSELDRVSGSPLSSSLGINGAVAIPSETFVAAVSVSGTAYFSGRLFFTEDDQNLFNDFALAIDDYAGEVKEFTEATVLLADYLDQAKTECDSDSGSTACQESQDQAAAQAAVTSEEQNDLKSFNRTSGSTTIIETDDQGSIVITEDPDLTSSVQVIAVDISEVALTLSRKFLIDGKNLAIGITPKLQTIKTFNYVANIEDDEIKNQEIKNTEQNFSDFNIDIGAAYQFGPRKQWQAGIVVKNLLSREYKTESNAYGPGNEETTETTISLDTQLRGGISHTTDWTVIAFDLDLMENAPVAFEKPTKYAAIGAELDLYDTLQLRLGYRKNLSVSDSAVASVGLGFSPFGIHLDIAAMANPHDPEKEAGAAFELGFYF